MRIRAQRNKVELQRGGNDGKWIRSPSTITSTITHTITNTITNVLQLRSQRAEEEDGGTTQEWTLSCFARTLALCQDSSRDSTDKLASACDPEDEAASDSDPEDRTKSNEYLGRVDTIVFCERWRYRRLETIVFCKRWHEPRVETIVFCECWHEPTVETIVFCERWHEPTVETLVFREHGKSALRPFHPPKLRCLYTYKYTRIEAHRLYPFRPWVRRIRTVCIH